MGWILLIILLLAVAYTFKPYVLPKIIWTHWDTMDMPELCRLNLERTRRMLPDWDVRFFTTADFAKWDAPIPEGFEKLQIQHKTDFMRLWLLKNYGGVWMDISVVLNTSLNGLWQECVSQQAEMSGFWIEKLTTSPHYLVFENWFIMAPQNSRLIAVWYEEFVKAIRMGFQAYQKATLREGVDPQKIIDDGGGGTYLTQHLCYQAVIQKRLWLPPHIILKRAEDTMFMVHSECGFMAECMKKRFATIDFDDIPWIKLRGGDRALFPIERLKE